MAKLRECLNAATRKLSGTPAARLEAEILLAEALESPRSFLYANPELDLPVPRIERFRKLVKRRFHGEPMAYITGRREFWSLPLRITNDVLIPRPETELLVEAALQRLPDGHATRIADLGTGSGAIALAIASERLTCEVFATDLSRAAIDLARKNATTLGLNSVRFFQGSWFEPLAGPFDMVVSNPPYVAADDTHLVSGDCRFEPREALSPGADALGAIRLIAAQAPLQLVAGGWLLLEHGADQGPGVRNILVSNGYSAVETIRDLAHHERVTLGRNSD